MTDLPAPVQVPLMLLSRLRGAFDTAVASLAERCAAGGTQVDAALFDKYQVEAYELAWTCAEPATNPAFATLPELTPDEVLLVPSPTPSTRV